MIILNEEQKLIQDTVARFMDEQFSFEQRLKILDSESGFDPDHWQQFLELGLLGIAIDESYSGFGGSLIDVATICQQQAKKLMMSPYLTTVGSAATAISLGGDEDQKKLYLGSIADGSMKISCALYETGGPDEPPRTEASKNSHGYVINGCKRLVPYGAQSDFVIVSAVIESQLSLVVVPTSSEGIKVRPYKMYDGSRSADMEFSDVKVEADHILTQGDAGIVEKIIDVETALLCAEGASIMWEIHDQTLEYMKIREQFDQTLSSMQALQHRIVDVYVKCQLAQSMAEDGVMAVIDGCDDNERARRISAAKIYVAEAGRQVGKEGIQLHGGIGMTNELPIGHYLKRLTTIGRQNGDGSWHRRRYRAMDDFKVN